MKQLFLSILLMLLPVMAWADPVEIDGIWYNFVTKAKVAEVVKPTSGSYSEIVTIPASVKYDGTTYSVTTIGSSAFSYCKNLTSITIPNSVINIGKSAFESCTGLTSITLPKGIMIIESQTFEGCTGLTSIDIPNSVTSIGWRAFRGCTGLTSIDIPNSVTYIDASAFSDCTGLTSIKIPNSLTSLTGFINCTGLTSIDIPNSVTSIASYAFYGCTGLTSINIPNSVTSIEYQAFSGCTGLTSINIPNSVTSIGYQSFSNCPNLENLYCSATSVPLTESNAFDDSYIEYATLHVPAEAIESYRTTAPWSNFKEIVTLPGTTYKLKYMLNDVLYKEYDIEYGATITPEPAPTKDGYTFSGWSYIPSKMPAEDVTVSGTFTANKYKLTYVVDGEEYKAYEIEFGAAITPEAEPIKEGYTFSGWSYIPSKMPAEDVTVVGTFIQTAIDGIHPAEASARIYDLNGNRIGKAKPGVNIIRQADGKTRKVVVR